MANQRIVSQSEAGLRLDQLLASWLPGTSRSRVQQWIGDGLVLLNERPGKRASERVEEGQAVAWDEPERPVAEDVAGVRVVELEVLHEDEHLVAIHKPAGLLSHRNHADQADSVVELATARFGELPSPERPDPTAVSRGGVVHRLDRGTSGVMLLARTPVALENLQRQFQDRSVEKRYQAWVHRSPRFDSETVDVPIEVDPHRPDRRRASRWTEEDDRPAPRPAITRVDVVKRFPSAASVLCMPKTGRTHQIRVHLLHMGLPIIGDRVYRWPGALPDPLPDDVPTPGRPALHAASIEVTHPATGERVRFEAPVPADLQRLDDWLVARG